MLGTLQMRPNFADGLAAEARLMEADHRDDRYYRYYRYDRYDR